MARTRMTKSQLDKINAAVNKRTGATASERKSNEPSANSLKNRIKQLERNNKDGWNEASRVQGELNRTRALLEQYRSWISAVKEGTTVLRQTKDLPELSRLEKRYKELPKPEYHI